jgi:hypothetical protein
MEYIDSNNEQTLEKQKDMEAVQNHILPTSVT